MHKARRFVERKSRNLLKEKWSEKRLKREKLENKK